MEWLIQQIILMFLQIVFNISILLNFLNNYSSISKFFGWHTIFPYSSTSMIFETNAKLLFNSFIISWWSLLSNSLEQFLNFSSNLSKSFFVIILAKILADLLIILAFSRNFLLHHEEHLEYRLLWLLFSPHQFRIYYQ